MTTRNKRKNVYLTRGFKTRAAFVLALSMIALGACKSPSRVSSIKADDEAVQPGMQGKGSFPLWAYDGGPDLNSEMGKELIDLTSKVPYFPGISQALYGDQMFRPAFGPIPWRMMQKPNSVKILFIGQDGTHIAEAAERPATAGFGGRAQDLAKYFGVGSSAAFINTFAFTIRWQYGAFDSPVVFKDASGKSQLKFASFTGNPVWLVSQDPDSPIVKWRNKLIEWIIRNNKDSLKLIVLFGGGARDAAGSFIETHGGKVGTRYTAEQLKNIKVAEFDLKGAGSNKQTSVPFGKDGSDLIAKFTGNQPNYTDPDTVIKVHNDFAAAFNADPNQWAPQMVFTNGGLNGSGMLNPAQLGGYDIDNKMMINGQQTISLKGLQISPDLTIDHDILVTQLPHPTALSMMTPQQASKAVGDGLKAFNKYVQAGWAIEADGGFTNTFATGQPYKYARGDMGTEYYDFGAPNSRMVNVSTASRSGANVIIFGTRDKANFDQNLVKAMTKAQPSKMPPDDEMWIAKPISNDRRATFDPGPGEKFAKLMKTNLPTDAAFLKAHETNGDFGHYRGTFNQPLALIVADPDGEDDLITARALTGSRGQYLHGMMEDMGIGDRYLVFKTAPYSMESQESADWKDVVTKTNSYREALLRAIMDNGAPKVLITDGPTAAAEVARILPDAGMPVINVNRDPAKKDSGIIEAMEAVKKVPGFETVTITGKMLDIPRTHLSYYARAWEGTSGDRVITSTDPQYKGSAFAEVAPQWAFSQKFKMSDDDVSGVKTLLDKVEQGKLRRGGETVQAFLARMQSGAAPQEAVVPPAAVEGTDATNTGNDSMTPDTSVNAASTPVM